MTDLLMLQKADKTDATEKTYYKLQQIGIYFECNIDLF